MKALFASLVLVMSLLGMPGYGPAQAGTPQNHKYYSVYTPELIQKLLDDEGLKTVLDKDEDGDPRLIGKFENIKYLVFFQRCKNGGSCEIMQFRAAFNLEPKPSQSKVNEWNRTRLFGRVYFSAEGKTEIDVPFPIQGGGTRENFSFLIKHWKLALQGFWLYFAE